MSNRRVFFLSTGQELICSSVHRVNENVIAHVDNGGYWMGLKGTTFTMHTVPDMKVVGTVDSCHITKEVELPDNIGVDDEGIIEWAKKQPSSVTVEPA